MKTCRDQYSWVWYCYSEFLRGNINVQFVNGVYAVLVYLTSYLHKPKHTISEQMKNVAKKWQREGTQKQLSIQKVFFEKLEIVSHKENFINAFGKVSLEGFVYSHWKLSVDQNAQTSRDFASYEWSWYRCICTEFIRQVC